MGMLLPQAGCCRGLSQSESSSRSLSHLSRSCVPHAANVVTVWKNVLRMDGFTLDYPAKYSNKNIKTHDIDQDKGLAVSHSEILLSLEVQINFLIDKVVAGCLFNIFEFSYLYNAERKYACMIYFFYATTVNTPLGFYTLIFFHMRLRLYDVMM